MMRPVLVTWFLLVTVLLRRSYQSDLDCPYPCDCNGLTINCANKGLTKIPKEIPADTQRM